MPWSGSSPSQSFSRTDGTRTGTTVWQEADAAAVDIVPDDHDTHDQDLATGINACLKKDGGNAATADIPMGGNKFTNVGDAAATNQFPSVSQLIKGGLYVSSVAGSANAVTLTTGLSVSAYEAGQTFRFVPTADNTGAVTVDVDGIGAQSVKRSDGTSALQAGDLTTGAVATIVYDGTSFQLAGNLNGSASADILGRVLPVGATIWWGLPTIPDGWVKLTGSSASPQPVTKTDYPELDTKYFADGYPYGASSASYGVGTMNLPPAAGRFIRVTDDGAGVDPDAASRTDRGDGTTGDAVGTLQDDEVKEHLHAAGTLAFSATTSSDGAHAHGGVIQAGAASNSGAAGASPRITSSSSVPTGSAGTHTHTVSGSVTGSTANTGGNETRGKNIYQYLILLANPAAASAASVGLFGLPYTFSATVTDADPGSGVLRLNNATLSSVTAAYISDDEANGADVSTHLLTWDDKTSTIRGTVKVTKVGAPSNIAIFHVTGGSTDATGYVKLALTYVTHNGSFSEGDNISVEFYSTGDKGDAGAAGPAGAAGSAAGLTYTFSTTTTDSDPGAGVLRANNASLSSATEIYIDDDDADGNTVADEILSWDDASNATSRGQLQIFRKSDRSTAFFDITGASTDATGYVKLSVTYSSGATSFSDTDELSVIFYRAGNDGGGSGDVTAASTFGTDNAVVRADGTGKGVQSSGVVVDDSNHVSGMATLTLPNTGLHLLDTNASHDLIIAPGSDLTADRTLTVTTGDASRTLTLNGDITPMGQGKHSIVIPAAAMLAASTSGAASGSREETTNVQNYNVYDFDASADEYVHFGIPMPTSWNEGTLTFQVYWTTSATDTDGVAWGLQAVAISDNEAIDAAWGTAIVVTDDAQGAAYEQLVTAESAAMTVAGTPAAGDLVYFRLFRDVSDANDDMTEDARLIAVKIFYTTDAATDA